MNGHSVDLRLLRLAVDKPGRVFLKHPITNEPLRAGNGALAWVDIRSRDSAEWQRRDREVSEYRSRRAADGHKHTPEEALSDAVRTLSEMTTGWCLVDLYGTEIELPFSPAAAAALYNDHGLAWLRDQVYAGAGDRALFMPARNVN